RTQGLKNAIELAQNTIPQPKEYQSLKVLSDRFNKNLTKVLIEELHYQADDKEKFIQNLISMRNNLDRMITFLSFQGDEAIEAGGLDEEAMDNVRASISESHDEYSELQD